MKKIIGFIAVIALLGALLVGCDDQTKSTSDQIQHEQQSKILDEATRQVGMPNIKNFFERKTMKKILEMRDNPDLTTYAYTQGMDGRMIYIGRSIGYGLPYGTQFTNPQQLDSHSESYGGNVTLPQADPNGLFSPDAAEATWLLLVDDKTNEVKIAYAEPRMMITETKLPRRLCAEWSLPADY